MTALPLEPHTEAEEATLARFEGAEPAEESAVERVALAIWLEDENHGVGEADRFTEADWLTEWEVPRNAYRRLATAAIEAMKGPSPAEEALARVEALAEDDEEVARMAREYEADKARRRERDYWHTLAGVREQSAARIRAAIAVPVAQAGEGR